MQLATLCEPRILELPVVVVCALVLAQVTTNHRTQRWAVRGC